MVLPWKKRKRARTSSSRYVVEEAALKRLADSIASDIAKCDPGGSLADLLHYHTVGDIVALCSLALPYECLTVEQTRLARQLQALYQKRDDLALGFDKRGRALQKFREAELLCKSTNDLFRQRARGQVCFLRGVESILFSSSRKIARMLGEAPRLADLNGYFGPGATTRTKKKNSHPLLKMEAGFSCSGGLACTATIDDCIPVAWRNCQAVATASSEIPLLVEEGVVQTVRKKYDIDRVIVVEPPLNGFAQNGLGQIMSSRARAHGLDLSTQEPNKLAAQQALTRDLATRDLSSASDTIARLLVWDQFPYDWVELFERLRSQEVSLDGEVIRLEKMSSMGNGFTFPLESLLFYGLAWACSESVDPRLCEEVRVFGDDIIVHRDVVPILDQVLHACGFLVNSEKSYADGPFFESCGGDYLYGVDVRPVYLRSRPTREQLYTLYNGLVSRGMGKYAAIVLSAIPHRLRVFGPPGVGDGVLVDPFFQKRRVIDKNGWERIPIKAWVVQTKEVKANTDSSHVLAFALYKAEGGVGPLDTRWRLRRDGTATYSEYPAEGSQTYRYDREGQLWITVPGASRARVQTIYITA